MQADLPAFVEAERIVEEHERRLTEQRLQEDMEIARRLQEAFDQEADPATASGRARGSSGAATGPEPASSGADGIDLGRTNAHIDRIREMQQTAGAGASQLGTGAGPGGSANQNQ